MAQGLLKSKAVQTALTIAIIILLAGMPFMASVATELRTAAVAVAGVIVLIAVMDAFRAVGGK